MINSDKHDIPVYTISVAAKLLGISVHTLRMYENKGLIIPHKKESGQRLYSDSDINRLKCIRKVINEDRLGIEGILKLLSFIPCWRIINCSSIDRENCQAYNGYTKPCWMLDHKRNVCSSRICRECTVYKDFSDCTKIKSSINQI